MTTEIPGCRVCGETKHIGTVLDLGPQRVSCFPTPMHNPAFIAAAPLELLECRTCGAVQLAHTVDPQLLFQDEYWYASGINGLMREELRNVVREARGWVKVHDGDWVLDIGANDGTLLNAWREHLWEGRPFRAAVEPSPTFAKVLEDCAELHIPELFPCDTLARMGADRRFRVITSVAMFYAVPDPVAFAQDVHALLTDDGVWIVQMQDLRNMIRATAFDNICLPSGDRILTERGLRAIDQVQKGERVYTHRGRLRSVVQTFTRAYRGDLIELQAYGMGHPLRVTPEHPVYVNREGWQWTPASEIRVGDVVARPVPTEVQAPDTLAAYVGNGRNTPELRMLPTDALLELFGYYLAEGSIAANGDVLFYFGPHETALAAECQQRIQGLGFAARIQENRTSLCVQAYGPLARVLETQCGRGASGKHLAPWMYGLTPEQAERLLRAYAAGDGYEYRENYLRASTVSEQLALDIAMLSNVRGWKCSINEQDRPATCVIEGRTVNQLPLWDILIHTDPQLQQKVWLADGYQCARIRHVERIPYFGYVHNIEVEEDNSYVSPGMAVHNCHEHLVYYDVRAFWEVCRRAGLRIVSYSPREINGGSLRFVCMREQPPPVPAGATILPRSENFCPAVSHQDREPVDWPGFDARIGDRVEALRNVVVAAKAHGHVVDLLGASTKGNTLLQLAGLGPADIRQCWERHPKKIGRHTVTGIPIVREDVGRLGKPDLLVCPIWQFRDALIAREHEFLRMGGRIYFPLPAGELYFGNRSTL